MTATPNRPQTITSFVHVDPPSTSQPTAPTDAWYHDAAVAEEVGDKNRTYLGIRLEGINKQALVSLLPMLPITNDSKKPGFIVETDGLGHLSVNAYFKSADIARGLLNSAISVLRASDAQQVKQQFEQTKQAFLAASTPNLP